MKKITFVFLITIISILCHAQKLYTTTHVYGIFFDFYYLEISTDSTYSLKIGMYGDNYISGKYEILGDTMFFTSINYNKKAKKLSKSKKQIIENGWTKYLIHDTLLIPLKLRKSPTISVNMCNDSTILKEYLQSDGHVQFRVQFFSDSTFYYRTGSDMGGYSVKGRWTENDNRVLLFPNDSVNQLNWICSDNILNRFENYLIGFTKDEKNGTIEYHYLLEKARIDK